MEGEISLEIGLSIWSGEDEIVAPAGNNVLTDLDGNVLTDLDGNVLTDTATE